MSTNATSKSRRTLCALAAIAGLATGTVVPSAEAALIGHWDLEAGSGSTAFDQSTTGNDGSFQNSPTWQTTGSAPVPSGSMADVKFDAADDDYISAPANSAYDFGSSTDFSFAAWIKTSTTDQKMDIAGQGDAADGTEKHWEVRLFSDGTLRGFIDDNANRK